MIARDGTSDFVAPLTDERCNYNAMIKFVTIWKLCTFKKNNFNK